MFYRITIKTSHNLSISTNCTRISIRIKSSKSSVFHAAAIISFQLLPDIHLKTLSSADAAELLKIFLIIHIFIDHTPTGSMSQSHTKVLQYSYLTVVIRLFKHAYFYLLGKEYKVYW